MKIFDSKVRPRTDQLLQAWTAMQKPGFAEYNEYINIYKMKSRLTPMPMQELIDFAAQSGVEKMLICGNDPEDNDHILDLAKKHDSLAPVCSVSVEQGIRYALREVERCCDLGATAIYMAPYKIKRDVNDHQLYPVYGYCELIQKPLILHGAIHYWYGSYMWHGQPRFVDEVAVDFPELKLIISQGGNGFGSEMIAVAQRHRNVYLEFSALSPGSMPPEFLYAANTYLRSKCTFGTDYPKLEFDGAIDKWKKVLREEVWEDFFCNNIIRALYEEPIRF
ncbi:MAG: amidohydrolase family protein [Spirochaetes bacterium]|nr:amidohydrolase family protein [Spirochaetota bacterium]